MAGRSPRKESLTLARPASAPSPIAEGGIEQFWAVVNWIGPSPGQGARWIYAVYEAALSSNGSGYELVPLPGGRSGEGLNTLEFAHTVEPASPSEAWIVWGVDVHGQDYPAGFNPLPVQQGNAHWVRRVDVPEGGHFYLFSAMGTHDGTCL